MNIFSFQLMDENLLIHFLSSTDASREEATFESLFGGPKLVATLGTREDGKDPANDRMREESLLNLVFNEYTDSRLRERALSEVTPESIVDRILQTQALKYEERILIEAETMFASQGLISVHEDLVQDSVDSILSAFDPIIVDQIRSISRGKSS